MSIREHIACLEDLSALDAEIRHLEEQLTQDREALATVKNELSKLEGKVAADGASIAEMSKTRGELVQEARGMATQIERSREKLSRARNEREQNAATRELEELRRLQKDREEEIGKLAMLEAAAQKSKEDAEAEHTKLLEQLSSSEASTSSRITQVEQERDTKAALRKQLTVTIPKNLLSRYDTIRKRKGTAIAQTQNGTCLACQMSLPPQLFQRILRDEVVELCPYCQRILYFKPPVHKDVG